MAPLETASGAASSSQSQSQVSAIVPPPPSAAPPDREQQELYDLMLARYLQDREDEAFRAANAANVDQDAAPALRLSLGEEGLADGPFPSPVNLSVIPCVR